MGRLTTHVLDTVRGQPAVGMRVRLFRMNTDRSEQLLAEVILNADGRCDAPLLEAESFQAGRYRLLFSVADYFQSKGVELPEPAFLDEVPIDFGISDTERHYHVPLLASPWAYSTYRGS